MHIADAVRSADMDLLVFQEVRMSSQVTSQRHKMLMSQLDEFRRHLPGYKWSSVVPAGSVDGNKKAVWTGWESEGWYICI